MIRCHTLTSTEKLVVTATSSLVTAINLPIPTELNKVLSHTGVWLKRPDIAKSKSYSCMLEHGRPFHHRTVYSRTTTLELNHQAHLVTYLSGKCSFASSEAAGG